MDDQLKKALQMWGANHPRTQALLKAEERLEKGRGSDKKKRKRRGSGAVQQPSEGPKSKRKEVMGLDSYHDMEYQGEDFTIMSPKDGKYPDGSGAFTVSFKNRNLAQMGTGSESGKFPDEQSAIAHAKNYINTARGGVKKSETFTTYAGQKNGPSMDEQVSKLLEAEFAARKR